MGKLNSTSLISLPIIRQSSRSKVFNHSLTGSTPLAERKNLAGSLFNLRPQLTVSYMVLCQKAIIKKKIKNLLL